MTDRIVLVTPTFAGDLERFALLRESIERCEIDLPHIAVVNTEDVAQFASVPFRRSLTIIPTSDVLPIDIERRRTARRYRRRNPMRRFRPLPLDGWYVQQLVKLSVPAFVDADVSVLVDSDVFFVRPVGADDFIAPNGKPYLFERQAVQAFDFNAIRSQNMSLVFLGMTPNVPAMNHTFEIQVFDHAVVRDLHAEVERRHDAPWYDAMATHRVMEFATYGVYARWADDLRRVEPKPQTLMAGIWHERFLPTYETTLQTAVDAGAKAGMVFSHLPLRPQDYRHVFEAVAR